MWERRLKHMGSGWGPGGMGGGSSSLSSGGSRPARLTIELLSEEREEDREVDGSLALLQHGIQLLLRDTHLPWGWRTEVDTGTQVSRAGLRLPSPPSQPEGESQRQLWVGEVGSGLPR